MARWISPVSCSVFPENPRARKTNPRGQGHSHGIKGVGGGPLALEPGHRSKGGSGGSLSLGQPIHLVIVD